MLPLTALLLVALAASTTTATLHPLDPSPQAVEQNAFRIFNSLHSAMRQWGSSLYHNGFAFIPAIVPSGTVLYHGTHTNSTPSGPEWLAFELEHSHAFARSRIEGAVPMPSPPGPPLRLPVEVKDQARLADDDDDKNRTVVRGYFHTYQAKRDLKLIYIDGMAAAKCELGTLDTTDTILLGGEPGDYDMRWGEAERARDICALVQPWGVDGVVRMEMGFEVILCDFSSGVELVSMTRQPTVGRSAPPDVDEAVNVSLLMWARATAQRYHDGIGARRVELDYSGATSALFYNVNTSSPWPERPDLSRVGSAARGDRLAIRESVKRNVAAWQSRREAGGPGTVDWQGVVDMITTRYSDRIAALASGILTPVRFSMELAEVAQVYVDAEPEDDDELPRSGGPVARLGDGDVAALARCQEHYLLPARVHRARWTETDRQFDLAVSTVTDTICRAFFAASDAVGALAGDDPDKHRAQFEAEAGRFRALQQTLQWTTTIRCDRCKPDEVCYIAVWPWGEREDHFNPRCKHATELRGRISRPDSGYWHI